MQLQVVMLPFHQCRLHIQPFFDSAESFILGDVNMYISWFGIAILGCEGTRLLQSKHIIPPNGRDTANRMRAEKLIGHGTVTQYVWVLSIFLACPYLLLVSVCSVARLWPTLRPTFTQMASLLEAFSSLNPPMHRFPMYRSLLTLLLSTHHVLARVHILLIYLIHCLHL